MDTVPADYIRRQTLKGGALHRAELKRSDRAVGLQSALAREKMLEDPLDRIALLLRRCRPAPRPAPNSMCCNLAERADVLISPRQASPTNPACRSKADAIR